MGELRNNDNEPVYDDKVNEVLRLLTEGIDRDEIAIRMGYNSYKSLDMYVRRRNFHWDADKQTYVPNYNRLEGVTLEDTIAASSKVSQIVTLFNNAGADAKVIAKRVGFTNHRELASYMTSKGYQWCNDRKNYVKELGIVNSTVGDDELGAEGTSNATTSVNTRVSSGSSNVIEFTQNIKNMNVEQMDLQQFVPLLIMLQKNKDKLVDMLVPQSEDGIIPRYALPGVFVTKSVHMVNTLDTMIREFSNEKNVTQRDVVATALIEFFRKYGYEREVDTLLNKRS